MGQYYTYNGYIPQYVQKQRQINLQNQSLHFPYETLMHLLSSAENFAVLIGEYYGAYNISSVTEYEKLKSEFAYELQCFKNLWYCIKKNMVIIPYLHNKFLKSYL